MNKAFLITSALFLASSIYAQDIFKKHGFDKETLTLSKGRYEEVFTNKEVVQIGSVLLNTKTNKVVKFLDEETEDVSFKAEYSSRWLSPDPLAEKYPQLSPYVYCNNNPVNAVDPTGKDYKMFIDQENNRITISATYYASTQDMASAQQAVDYWNNQSGNFTYQTKDGGNYTVDFSLNAVEVQTDASMTPQQVTGELNKAFTNDKSGAGNVFQVVDNSRLDTNENGKTSNGNSIQVKDAQKSADTGAHEVGHTLGLVHSSSGLMTPASTDPNRSGNLDTGGLKDMMTYPLSGKTNSEDGNKAGRGTVTYFNQSNSTDRLYDPLNKKGKIVK